MVNHSTINIFPGVSTGGNATGEIGTGANDTDKIFLGATHSGISTTPYTITTTNVSCAYVEAQYLFERFVLITVFGSMVCLIGIVSNALLLYLLTRRPLMTSHVFYMAVLAFCDVIVEIAYVMVISMQLLYDFMKSLTLYYAWNTYLKPMFAVTHVSMTMSTYLIVAATAERYLSSDKLSRRTGACTPMTRMVVVGAIFCFALISKGMVYFELDVIHKPQCSGFETFTVMPSSLMSYEPYKVGFVLWFRHIVHIFLPFVVLICLNAAILFQLKQWHTEPRSTRVTLLEANENDEQTRHKGDVRAATRMLGAIVTTYLVSNVSNVVITLIEHIDQDYLYSQGKFYAFTVDVTNLLPVFTGAIRLPIYCACNAQLRNDLVNLFKGRQRDDRIRFTNNNPEEEKCLTVLVKSESNSSRKKAYDYCTV